MKLEWLPVPRHAQERFLLRCMSPFFGTKRTLPPCSMMSAFGGKADVTQTSENVRL
jgi:hypothetical protein